MRAESAGNDQVVILGATGYPIAVGSRRTGLKQAIQSALEENRYELATETLTSANGSLVRTEAMLMLRTAADQMPIPATLFIPPAVRLDLVADCDLQAVALGSWLLAANEGELAVRVAALVARPEILPPAGPVADRVGARWRLLFLEIDAHGLVECHERDRHAGAGGVGIWRAYRRDAAGAAIRRGGAAAYAAAVLREAGRRLRGRHVAKPGSQQLTASVLQTARALNIAVYAEDVPDAETQRILAGLGINVMRGPGVRPQGRQG